MLSRELDEAIMILRDNTCTLELTLSSKLADLLLVCAVEGDIIQTVAENVAKEIISLHKGNIGQIELRDA
jgi:hypothetical protein